jgi:hypothetical protein
VRNYGNAHIIHRAAMKHLEKNNGYIIAVSSIGAQLRTIFGSDYQVSCCSSLTYLWLTSSQISKHALNRLVEFITIGMGEMCLPDLS